MSLQHATSEPKKEHEAVWYGICSAQLEMQAILIVFFVILEKVQAAGIRPLSFAAESSSSPFQSFSSSMPPFDKSTSPAGRKHRHVTNRMLGAASALLSIQILPQVHLIQERLRWLKEHAWHLARLHFLCPHLASSHHPASRVLV